MKIHGLNSRFNAQEGSIGRFVLSSVSTAPQTICRTMGIFIVVLAMGIQSSSLMSNSAWAATDPEQETKVEAKPANNAKKTEAGGQKIKLNYRSASWPRVFQDLSEANDMEFVGDHVPEGRFSRFDKSEHTRKDALRIINAELEPQGFRLVEKGRFLILLETTLQRPRSPSVANPAKTKPKQPAEDPQGSVVQSGFRTDSVTRTGDSIQLASYQESDINKSNRDALDKTRQSRIDDDSHANGHGTTQDSTGSRSSRKDSSYESENGIDPKQVMKALKQIDQLSESAAPRAHLLRLKSLDVRLMAELLTNVYESSTERSVPSTSSHSNVAIIAVKKSNSLLIVASETDLRSILDLAGQLDNPVDPQTEFQVFRLRSSTGIDARKMIADFYQERTTVSDKALMIAEVHANAIIIRALPGDLDKIEKWIAKKLAKPMN